MTKEFRQVELINYIQKYSFKNAKTKKKKNESAEILI